MNWLTLEAADQIVQIALAKRRERGFQPLAVAVLDAGGSTVVIKREDHCSLMRVSIANAKAWGALGMGSGGRDLEKRAEARPAFFATLTHLAEGRMVPGPGGVLIKNQDGLIIGAVGISGDHGPNDEECAVAGIRAVGMIADPGAVA